MKIYKLKVGLVTLKQPYITKRLNDVIAIINDDEDLFRYIKAKYVELGYCAVILDNTIINDFFVSDKILH
ncbi:MAG: hypothetical protein ACOCVF_02525 [bacterium]